MHGDPVDGGELSEDPVDGGRVSLVVVYCPCSSAAVSWRSTAIGTHCSPAGDPVVVWLPPQ